MVGHERRIQRERFARQGVDICARLCWLPPAEELDPRALETRSLLGRASLLHLGRDLTFGWPPRAAKLIAWTRSKALQASGAPCHKGSVPRIILDITDELASELLNRSVDAVAVCLTALREAVNGCKMSQNKETVPAAESKKMGRPPGLTRHKRTINLEPRLWTWLESKAQPGESFNDTCNRVLDAASKLLP